MPANLQTSRGARYQPVVVATTAGKVLNDLVQTETDAHVELIDAETKITRIPKSDRAPPYEILARQRSTNRR